MMMICSNHTESSIKNAFFYNAIEEIPQPTWDALDCTNHIYFHPDYFISLEKNNPQIQFLYLVLKDDSQKPIAFASIQIIDFLIDSIRNDLELLIRKVKNIARKLRVFPAKKPIKILVCGNVFVSGEHGIFIQQQQDKKEVLKVITKTIVNHVNLSASLKNDVSIFLLKDFEDASLNITGALKEVNYYSFKAEPNMQLKIDESWQNFDDYLASMKTKFRVKARKAFKQSVALSVEKVTLKNIEHQLSALQF